jgi:uncharacterized phage-associated protein
MISLHDAADYVLVKALAADLKVDNLKLQKLVYYTQAWHLAFYGEPLFDGKFQAWVHGPVSRELYARFASTHSMYSRMTEHDIRQGFAIEKLPDDACLHIDSVLEVYGDLTGAQLEAMTHDEKPWLDARGDLPRAEKCATEISNETMRDFYRSRLNGAA